IDSPIGEALLAHVQVLTHTGVGVEPEERLLSELGVWLPLPPTSQLTGREREIALFTSSATHRSMSLSGSFSRPALWKHTSLMCTQTLGSTGAKRSVNGSPPNASIWRESRDSPHTSSKFIANHQRL